MNRGPQDRGPGRGAPSGGRGDFGRPDRERPGSGGPPGLPPGYLANGYFTGQGDQRSLDINLLLDTADGVAAALPRDCAGSLRAFFQAARAFIDPLRHGEQPWEAVRPGLASLESKAQYQRARNVGVDDNFVQFIGRNVREAVRSPEDARAFLQHFQAVFGYWRGRNPQAK